MVEVKQIMLKIMKVEQHHYQVLTNLRSVQREKHEHHASECLPQDDTEEDDESLAKKLKAENPVYFATQRRSTRLDSIILPDTDCQINYQPRGHQSILGWGKVNIGLKHPQVYVEHVRKWFNLLEWPREMRRATSTLLKTR